VTAFDRFMNAITRTPRRVLWTGWVLGFACGFSIAMAMR
jgi:hypothetical protein